MHPIAYVSRSLQHYTGDEPHYQTLIWKEKCQCRCVVEESDHRRNHKLLVEKIVCVHGVPEQLPSDRGANFLSDLVLKVCSLLGIENLNTSDYHPQTDGLVEKFNSTLIMISKSSTRSDDWDERLPFLLFAYRVSAQESTKESPLYLLHSCQVLDSLNQDRNRFLYAPPLSPPTMGVDAF